MLCDVNFLSLMLQSLCKFLYFRLLGWTVDITVPHRDKCILCVAPHTSNWDFILGEIVYTALGRKAGFLMKKEWFFWPMGKLLRYIGGIPVYRSKQVSLTDQLAQLAQQSSYFNLAVTPEGTRSKVDTWKRGFYHIAHKADIPIQLFAIDAVNKKIVCTREIFPTGDVEADVREIMNYYRAYEGRAIHPEKFAVESL